MLNFGNEYLMREECFVEPLSRTNHKHVDDIDPTYRLQVAVWRMVIVDTFNCNEYSSLSTPFGSSLIVPVNRLIIRFVRRKKY